MSAAAWLILSAGMLLGADPGSSSKDDKVEHKPSAWAPSLPGLTQEEEQKLDDIVDRFIQFDAGKLTGDDGKKAKEDFDKLGPDATFALIRGLNRAAKLETSCPAVTIAKKLGKIMATTEDKELLDFAKENVGAGAKDSRHAPVIADLKLTCQTRRAYLVRAKVPDPPPYGSTTTATPTPLNKLTVAELANIITTGKTAQAKQATIEIATRAGDEPLNALASAATTVSDPDVKQAARDALDKALSRLKPEALAEKLKDKNEELRAAAERVSGKSKK